MEGSGHFMLIGGDKQSEGKKALNQEPNASPSASQRRNGLRFKQPNLQTSGKRVANYH